MILTIPTPASRAASPDEELLRLEAAIRDTAEAERRATFRVQMAKCLHDLGEWQRGMAQLAAANRESPKNPYVLRGLGMATCRTGDWRKGLRLYDEGRWQMPSFDKFKRPYPFRPWQGQDLVGKRILVWAEQGIGDQVMQARVLADLLERGAQVDVECEPRLIALFQRCFPTVEFHTQTVSLVPALLAQKFDFQVSMLSAWRWASRSAAEAKCMGVDRGLCQQFQRAWQKQDRGERCLNVGLAWSSRAKATGERRSLSLSMLSLLPGIAAGRARFHNLQYGEYDSAALSRQLGAPLWTDAQGDPLKNLDRQCAQIAALDLVITIDNATAHLAGALGVPCWVLMPKGSEFRWGTDEETTAMYKSVRLFRSTDSDSWGAALLRVADALGQRLEGRLS
ncbi:MAG: hypothetical protein AAGK33_05075 [Pseudomonadota bacterium]